MLRRLLRPRGARRFAGGFTLIELLVVIGILGLLGVLTIISVQRLSRSSRVSSSVNTVTNFLQSARAYAIRENKLVVVAFRPIWDVNNKQRPQQTELVAAEWTKEGIVFAGAPGQLDIADRFVPINGLPSIRLPAGIKVAGPLYEDGEDGNWVTQGEMSQIMQGCREAIEYSRMIAVMFAPDGALVTRNPAASAGDSKAFIDFNLRDLSPADNDPQDVVQAGGCATSTFQQYWMQDNVEDETNLTLVPFLAIFDDRQARESAKFLDWSNSANMVAELLGPNGFVTTNGQRIHFNRFTGVAEVQQ
jgi:prepilin-type N-terminal cleavage/methylation domain-containing protein